MIRSPSELGGGDRPAGGGACRAGSGAHHNAACRGRRPPAAVARALDEDQYDWLLKPALRADKLACIALTESEAGSDLGAIATRAAKSSSGWTLNGSKQFISNAETSDYILILTVTEPSAPLRERFTVFVVDRTNPGLHFTHRFRKLGWHGYHISAFSLDDCHVGPERVLGGVGNGFETIMASVNKTRLYIAARCVGAAQELIRLGGLRLHKTHVRAAARKPSGHPVHAR